MLPAWLVAYKLTQAVYTVLQGPRQATAATGRAAMGTATAPRPTPRHTVTVQDPSPLMQASSQTLLGEFILPESEKVRLPCLKSGAHAALQGLRQAMEATGREGMAAAPRLVQSPSIVSMVTIPLPPEYSWNLLARYQNKSGSVSTGCVL